MIAFLKDTETGAVKIKYGIRSFEYAENNLSCDCNRQIVFGLWDDSGICIGAKRFLVVGAIFEKGDEEYTLNELNADYPYQPTDDIKIDWNGKMI